ncbi:MAG TPA: dihydrodipicolinate synthase family protein [Nitriliruptorales bacterium]
MSDYDRSDGWTARIRGVVAAPLTPFDARGGLDLDAVPGLVDFLLRGGVAGLMVGGTTGEFVALDRAERAAVLDAFIEAVDGRVPVIAHVGHVHVTGARELAEHAARVGADATTALTPYYHRASAGAISRYFRDLARTTPQLPFFVYNYPDAAGNPVAFELFEDLLDVPNVAGVKLSVGTFEELEPYLALDDELCVMSGNDGLAPRFVRAGGRAVVSGNAAAFPDVISALVGALLSGEEDGVEAAWQRTLTIIELGRSGAPDRLRDLLAARGIDLGPARIRTFIDEDVPADHAAALRHLLDELA